MADISVASQATSLEILSAVNNLDSGCTQNIVLIDSENSMGGIEMTIHDSNNLISFTVTYPSDGSSYITVPVPFVGTWIIEYENASGHVFTHSVVISEAGSYAEVVSSIVPIPSFSTGSLEEIKTFIDLCYTDPTINLSDYWNIGDTRRVSINGEAADLVVMNFGGFELTNSYLGSNTCKVVVGLKESLTTTQGHHTSGTNAGSWNSSDIRTWCNNTFKNQIEAASCMGTGLFKQFKVVTASEYNASTTTTSYDFFTLPAEKEVIGYRSKSNETEANALTQLDYYNSNSNKKKKLGVNGSAFSWWTRSPYVSYFNSFCSIGTDGYSTNIQSNFSNGVSPFGVF